MDSELLESYKKMRTSVQKLLISRLNTSQANFLEDWNELPLIKQTLYRARFDTFMNDSAKKQKDEITKLRLMKKSSPQDVFQNDVDNLISCIKEIPESKNPYDWITKFRTSFLKMDCFPRVVLFGGRIDCKDLWDYNVIGEVCNYDNLPNLENANPDEQFDIMKSVVGKLLINPENSKYVEDTSEINEYFSMGDQGQIGMNI